MTKPDQLRIAANIIEHRIPWQRRYQGGPWNDMATYCPALSVVNGYEIQLLPTPVLVPLGPEDVPPGSIFRTNTPTQFKAVGYALTAIYQDGIHIITEGGSSFPEWDTLMRLWEIKRPGEDWTACSKPG